MDFIFTISIDINIIYIYTYSGTIFGQIQNDFDNLTR